MGDTARSGVLLSSSQLNSFIAGPATRDARPSGISNGLGLRLGSFELDPGTLTDVVGFPSSMIISSGMSLGYMDVCFSGSTCLVL